MPVQRSKTEWISTHVYMGIAFASLAYSVYLIIKFRHQYAEHPVVFSKRHPRLLLSFVVSVVIASFVAGPLMIYGHMINQMAFVNIAGTVLNQLFMSMTYKVFIFVYDVRYEIFLAQFHTHKKWKMYLDERWDNECWFVEHKNSLGRFLFVTAVGMGIWGLFAVPYIILRMIGNFELIAKIILLVQAIPPMVLGLAVWLNTPAVTDVFHLRDQVSWLIRSSLVCCIVYAVFAFNDHDKMSSFYFGYMFTLVSPVFLFFLLDYPMRVYLRDQAKKQTDMNPMMLSTLSSTNSVSKTFSLSKFRLSLTSPRSVDSNQDGGNDKETRFVKRRSSMGRQMLREVLGNIVTFEMFMEHLMKEFSYENLLFIIEVTQFKDFMLSRYPDLKTTPNVNHGLTIHLPAEVPKSVTIHDDKKTVREKAEYLYAKYVDSAALLEVNVAYQIRLNLAALFDASFSDDSAQWTPTMSPSATPRNSLPDVPDLTPARQSSELSLGNDLHRVISDSRSRDSDTHKAVQPSIVDLYSAFDDAYKQIFTLLLDSMSRFQRQDSNSGSV